MSKTQHTQGPWENQEGFNTVFTTQDPKSRTGVTIAIAKALSNQVEGGYAEATANARLIAAAPELLEALNDLLPYTDDLCDAGPEGQGWKSPELNATIDKARAAIAKAGSAA